MSLAALAHYAWQGDFDHGVAKVICPLHEETAPSMWVYVQQGTVHCFGCNWSGTVVKLVSVLEGSNQIGALIKLRKWARKHDLDNIKFTPADMEQEPKEPLDPAKSYLAGMPSIVDSETRAEYYMVGRGFTRETLERFDIRVHERSEWPVVIPIACNGIVVAWQKRSLDNRKDKYKYVYGSNSSHIVGGDTVGKVVLICEGYLDMMMAWQHLQALGGKWTGVKVCTPLSWLIRPHQARQVDASIVVLALDNDKRGREGAAVAVGLLPRMVQLDWESGAHDIGSIDVVQFKREMVRALKRDTRR
jgi:hypothetical protein